ncbi:hypothetical protein E2C01_058416 [Portunus trituberculatus]|uniref:Uncharacterized protein n=1 Tax=Portunus trituberculatus TaxID=210409 RepID=A0A5B7H622_PORTR|nr:hypothetical protein [Portunus trituberculatus]
MTSGILWAYLLISRVRDSIVGERSCLPSHSATGQNLVATSHKLAGGSSDGS